MRQRMSLNRDATEASSPGINAMDIATLPQMPWRWGLCSAGHSYRCFRAEGPEHWLAALLSQVVAGITDARALLLYASPVGSLATASARGHPLRQPATSPAMQHIRLGRKHRRQDLWRSPVVQCVVPLCVQQKIDVRSRAPLPEAKLLSFEKVLALRVLCYDSFEYLTYHGESTIC